MSSQTIGKLSKLGCELRLLGFKGVYKRVLFEIKRRGRIDTIVKRPRSVSVNFFLSNCFDSCNTAYAYWNHWNNNLEGKIFDPVDGARQVLDELLPESDKASLVHRADAIIDGRFLFFSKQEFKIEGDIWKTDPESGTVWPSVHSSRLLLQLAKYGDIKLVWELGRFRWVLDLIRAWIVTDDRKYIQQFLKLVNDFSDKNELYIGPQWCSEQEVAIRAIMIVFALDMLRGQDILCQEDLLNIHGLLEMHAEFLEHDLDYAEFAIRNNHLIHGALGLYVIGHTLWNHKNSKAWCDRGKKILEEAAEEQWYSDGGYIQPSHNYHRSAWHGLLWANIIAKKRKDASLQLSIKKNAVTAFRFLSSQVDFGSGMLPNWGPNDGALIGCWTACDYVDFRPLLQSLAFLAEEQMLFDSGPWDEEVFWFFGQIPDHYAVPYLSFDSVEQFPIQGIHVIRSDDRNFASFRCGSIKNRYGQQADQLHVDIWLKGTNIALDAGSFNYNKNGEIHNWFRGTKSHNTVIVAEQDQMIPHRTFKYLRWAKAEAKAIDLGSNISALVGVHHGYTRLKGQWVHARLLFQYNDHWIIVDRLWPKAEIVEKTSLRLHWLLVDGTLKKLESGRGIEINANGNSFFCSFVCSNNECRLETTRASARPSFDGWASRYYNSMSPANSVNLESRSENECLFVSVFGPSELGVSLRLDDRELVIGKESISIDSLYSWAPEAIETLMNE